MDYPVYTNCPSCGQQNKAAPRVDWLPFINYFVINCVFTSSAYPAK